MDKERNIMDRIGTRNYIFNEFLKGRRVVVTRYGDGEYHLMRNEKYYLYGADESHLCGLLLASIKNRNQLVCVPYLKPHNIENKDVWFDAANYFIKEGGQPIYGSTQWNVYDFVVDLKTIPKFFEKETLIITGFENEVKEFFKNRSDIYVLGAPAQKASVFYESIKASILKCLQDNFKNVVFAIGAVGKVIATDIIDKCEANILDIGSLLNILAGVEGQWPASWTNSVDLEKRRLLFRIKVGL